jgi:hypothetical protein
LEVSGLLPDTEFSTVVTREFFEAQTENLIKEMVEPVLELIAKSGVKESDILSIELFGGSVRIPKGKFELKFQELLLKILQFKQRLPLKFRFHLEDISMEMNLRHLEQRTTLLF